MGFVWGGSGPEVCGLAPVQLLFLILYKMAIMVAQGSELVFVIDCNVYNRF